MSSSDALLQALLTLNRVQAQELLAAARAEHSPLEVIETLIRPALEQIGRIHAIPAKRHDQKLIRHLTMEEVRAILNAPNLATRSGLRDRAMMHLCFAGGLRVSELVGVLTENLSLLHGANVTIRAGCSASPKIHTCKIVQGAG